MKRIYVRMRGGLGNQMFQYAFACLFSNDDDSICMDIREYPKYKDWPFTLNDFKLRNNTKILKEGALRYDNAIKKYHFVCGVYKRIYSLFNRKGICSFDYVSKRKRYVFGSTFSPFPSCSFKNDLFLYGYFQDASQLLPIRKELIHYFTPNTISDNCSKYLDVIGSNSLMVSVRTATQVELDKGERYVYETKEKYLENLSRIRKKSHFDQIVVFANDIQRVKNEKWFEEYQNVIYIEGCSAVEQIEIMKLGKDFIISNSTFSWWGAFLGSYNKNSVVLAPEIWYEGNPFNKTKLFFDNMVIAK